MKKEDKSSLIVIHSNESSAIMPSPAIAEQGPPFSDEDGVFILDDGGRLDLARSNEIFNKRVKELRRFKAKHGHMRVTRSIDDSLSRWCTQIRGSFRAKGRGEKANRRLTDERIRALKSIGFEFVHSSTAVKNPKVIINGNYRRSNESFYKRLKELHRFKAKHGHLDVTPRINKSLAYWCRDVKFSYRNKIRGNKVLSGLKLTSERVAALEELGFKFPTEKKAPIVECQHSKNCNIPCQQNSPSPNSTNARAPHPKNQPFADEYNKDARIHQEKTRQKQQQIEKYRTQNVNLRTQHDLPQHEINMSVLPQQQLLGQEPYMTSPFGIEDDYDTNVMRYEDEPMAIVNDASSRFKPRYHKRHLIEQSSSSDSEDADSDCITFNDQLDYDRRADLLSIYQNA